MKSPEDIVGLYRERQRVFGPQREQMRDILNLYQGDIAVPLPEMRSAEKPSIVNLAKQGINQMGMRAASVLPTILTPPIPTGRFVDANTNAIKRHKILTSWWDDVGMNMKLRQRGRWLFAYAHAPVLIHPDFKNGRPTWRPVSPIDTYPAPMTEFDDMVPRDSIIVSLFSAGYVRATWPQSEMTLRGIKDDVLVEVLHYIDSDEYHTVVTPKVLSEEARSAQFTSARSLRATTLDWQPNLTGRPWVVMARCISLERPVGLFDGMVGMYEAQAELNALSKIARRKGVFWEEWLVGDANSAPEILVRANPYSGEVGIVRGGKLERMTPEVQYSTDTGEDRLERAQRIEAGLPADFGGEAGSNIRTGARATQLIQSAVDPVLQETHEIFSRSLQEENYIAIAIDKAYWSGRKKTVWLGREAVSYDPAVVWETDRHRIDYSMAGADINQMTIVPLQMVGAGMMSRRTGMGYHPLIKDVDEELDRVVLDQLEKAALTGIEQLIASPGGMPLTDVIRVASIIKSGDKDFLEAMVQVQQEAQDRQAKMAEQQSQAQPGINMPGQGAEQPSIPPPSAGMNNLRGVLNNLRRTSASPGEAAAGIMQGG